MQNENNKQKIKCLIEKKLDCFCELTKERKIANTKRLEQSVSRIFSHSSKYFVNACERLFTQCELSEKLSNKIESTIVRKHIALEMPMVHDPNFGADINKKFAGLQHQIFFNDQSPRIVIDSNTEYDIGK